MLLKICRVIMITVGVLSLILSIVSAFMAGVNAVIFFAILGIFIIAVGRWLI